MTLKKVKKKKEKKVDDLLLEIIPENKNLTKVRASKKKKTDAKPKNAKVVTTKKLDPLNNCLDFIRFYHSIIAESNPKAKFNSLVDSGERIVASVIMDLLIDENKNDKLFLRSWIEYHAKYNLNGIKGQYKSKTTLSEFMKTFGEYRRNYKS